MQARACLASPAFICAVHKILQGHVSAVRGLQPRGLQQVSGMLMAASTKLCFVSELQTRLVHKRTRLDVTREGSGAGRVSAA